MPIPAVAVPAVDRPAVDRPATGLTLLILGGTREAGELAVHLDGTAGLRVVTALAGRLQQPVRPNSHSHEVRTGGFGGVEGLVGWLRANAPAVLVDATHPFAAQVSRHAVAAAAATGAPLVRLQRPGFRVGPGDRWHRVPDLAAAADVTPSLGVRPLVTTGKQGLAEFTGHPVCGQLDLVLRCVEPPADPLPPRTRLLLDRGPYTLAGERAVFAEHRIDVLVTKDSGGAWTSAKLDVARELGLPVVVVDRPPAGDAATVARTVDSADEAHRWVQAQLAEGVAGRLGDHREPSGD